MRRRPPRSTRTYTLFPYTTLFRSRIHASVAQLAEQRSPKPQVVGSSPTWRATCGSYAKRGSPRTNPPTGQSGNFVNSRVEQPKSASPADVAMYALRSEEHTSELQSLMRISYAVFCLIKKNKIIDKYLNYTTIQAIDLIHRNNILT